MNVKNKTGFSTNGAMFRCSSSMFLASQDRFFLRRPAITREGRTRCLAIKFSPHIIRGLIIKFCEKKEREAGVLFIARAAANQDVSVGDTTRHRRPKGGEKCPLAKANISSLFSMSTETRTKLHKQLIISNCSVSLRRRFYLPSMKRIV